MFDDPSAHNEWMVLEWYRRKKRKGESFYGSRFNETIIGIWCTFRTRNTSLES